MNAAAVYQDIISLLDDDSEGSTNEEESTLKIMGLFEVNKPLQSAIIFESDNESSRSSSDSHLKTKARNKSSKESCSKTKKPRTKYKNPKRRSSGNGSTRINKVKTYVNKTKTVREVKYEMDGFSAQKNIKPIINSKAMHEDVKEENKECCMPHIQKKIKIESNLEEKHPTLRGMLKNDDSLNNAAAENKIKQEPSEGHEDSGESVEDNYRVNYKLNLEQRTTSNNGTPSIPYSFPKGNMNTLNINNDTAIPNENQAPVDNIQTTSVNLNIDNTQSNAITSSSVKDLENRPTSLNDNDKNIVITNAPQDANESSRSMNFMIREILNIMYDMIKFKHYYEVLEKENTEISLKKKVQEEFEKYLITALASSWQSVVSHVLIRENITYSFIYYILNKGKGVAETESKHFNEKYFVDVLKYFMKQYIRLKVDNNRHQNTLPANSTLDNTTHTNINEGVTQTNQSYLSNIAPMTNSDNGNPEQTNAHVLNSQSTHEMLSQDRGPYSIKIDKNNVQFMGNVKTDYGLTATNTRVLGITSPVVPHRTDNISVNNMTLANTSGNYENKLINPTNKQPPSYFSTHAIDKKYQYGNMYNMSSTNTAQPTANRRGIVKENPPNTLQNNPPTPHMHYNIARNQVHSMRQNYALHPNGNTAYRPHVLMYAPPSSASYGLTQSPQRQPQPQPSVPSSKTPFPPVNSNYVRSTTLKNSGYYIQQQPVAQTQNNHVYAANQNYGLNYTNNEASPPAYQTGITTLNQEQARSSISRDSGFMSPSTSYEQTAPSVPDSTPASVASQQTSNADSLKTNLRLYPCIVCGRRTQQKCNRCWSIYLCSNQCMQRVWNSHRYVCGLP